MKIDTLSNRLNDFCVSEEVINRLAGIFEGHGRLYLVGGAVRDLLRGKLPSDIDITTDLRVDDFQEIIKKQGIRVIPTGIKHDTVSVIFTEDLSPVEMSSLRMGSCSIEDDLGFRDFTINAIAYSIFEKTVIDPYMGVRDLELKLISAVRNAEERFHEDPLRILRFARLCCEQGFNYDQATFDAAQHLNHLVGAVAIERIRDELSKILLSNDPPRGIQILYDTGVLQHILPEIAAYYNFEQNEFHKADLFRHTMEIIENTESDLILRLAALLHDVGKPSALFIDQSGHRHFYRHENIGADIAENLLTRLKYPHQIISAVVLLIKTHMRPLDCGPGGLRRLLRDTAEHYSRWRALKEADTLACKVDSRKIIKDLEKFDQRITTLRQEQQQNDYTKLQISGYDLMNIGVKPGPAMGNIIAALKEHVLDYPEDNIKERLILLASRFAGSNDR